MTTLLISINTACITVHTKQCNVPLSTSRTTIREPAARDLQVPPACPLPPGPEHTTIHPSVPLLGPFELTKPVGDIHTWFFSCNF